MAHLELKNVIISTPQGALCNPINLDLFDDDIVTIMGPSGCGKSTLLSAIAGHLENFFSLSGEIRLDNRSLLELPAHLRHVGILFQDDMLFPHFTIWQNLAFALPPTVKSKHARKQRALETLQQINLAEHANKSPHELSGGQRARISLMRALLAEPKVLLLDEPFSKLDPELRQVFREFVFTQVRQANITTLMVTHDIADVPQDGTLINWLNI